MNDLAPALVVIFALCGICFGSCAFEDSRQRSECHKLHLITGRETRYPEDFNLDEGCFVMTEAGWVPAKYWRGQK